MPRNILRADPTRTTTLRRQYEADMLKRFNTVRSKVIQTIWKLDALGLDTNKPFTFNQEQAITNQLPERQVWRFRTDSEKLGSFQTWFQEQIDEDILSVTVAGKPWSAKYVDSAYRKGVIRSYNEVRKEATAANLDFYEGQRSQFLESSFAHPERLSKIQFLATRSFEELKGITAAMSQQIGRVLANGIANGLSAQAIAREMSKTITGITKKRALVLARTEIIAAHAEGQLDSFEELGIDELTVMAEWSTAGDDLVCDLCMPLEGAVMSVNEARGLIPRHPNCRCAWIPANVGEKGTAKRRAETPGKIDRSIIAELPKRTRAGVRVPQTIREGAKRSGWAGKDLLEKEVVAAPTAPSATTPVREATSKATTQKQIDEALRSVGADGMNFVDYTDEEIQEYLEKYSQTLLSATDDALNRAVIKDELTDYRFVDSLRIDHAGGVGGEGIAHGSFHREIMSGTRRMTLANPEITGASLQQNVLNFAGWSVDSSYSGVIRHEYGHAVQSVIRQNNFRLYNEWQRIADDVVPQLVSEYGATNASELFAESFSAYTHPNYTGGLPDVIQEFFDRNIGVKL